MKCVKLIILTTTLLVAAKFCYAEWEIISENARMTQISVIDGKWYGIEYNGSSAPDPLLVSDDYGNSWDTVPGFSFASLLRVHDETIIVSGNYNGINGLYMSTDNMNTWTSLTYNFSSLPHDILITDEALYYLVNWYSAVESPIYRSYNNGNTWEALVVDSEEIINVSSQYGCRSLIEHQGNICAYLGSYGFYMSSNEGDTWTNINTGLDYLETLGPASSASLHSAPDGLYLTYYDKVYKFENSEWIVPDVEAYYYDLSTETWRLNTGSFLPNRIAYKPPYIFAVDALSLGYLYYSLDNGTKWFRFSGTPSDFTSVSRLSVMIAGNYVYAGSSDGFGRRSLSEAINPILEIEPEQDDAPFSPDELDQLMLNLGAGSMDELIDMLGIDSDELLQSEIDEILSGISGDNFFNSQPGTCSFMGMPGWMINPANFRLFFRDVIFRKKGLGPETILAINATNSADTAINMFGKYRLFEYESCLLQADSLLLLTTGSGARFLFSDSSFIDTTAGGFELPCLNHENFVMHWTGSHWQLEKGIAYQFMNFEHQVDSLFHLTSVEDAYGFKLQILYNLDNQIEKILDASGREYGFHYQGGLCDSISLPDGKYARFEYNDNKQMVLAVDLSGLHANFNYDSENNINAINIGGKLSEFVYDYNEDTLGRVSQIIDSEGRLTEFTSFLIDSMTRMNTIAYPDNRTKSYLINKETNRLRSIVNLNDDEIQIHYNEDEKIQEFIDADGSITAFVYDSEGNLIEIHEPNGDIRTFVYNENRKLIQELDSDSQVIYTKTYNLYNQLLSIVYLDNATISFSYDDNGALASVTSPEDYDYYFERDVYGNLSAFTNSESQNMSFEYDVYGLYPIAHTDFAGNIYDLQFDANGRLESITKPDGSSEVFTYDCCAQMSKSDENGNLTSVVRDATNRILQKSWPAGYTAHWEYDDAGNLKTLETPYGTTKRLTYNKSGLLIKISDEEGSIRYEYNEKNLLTSVKDKKGNQTSFNYNNNHQLVGIVDAMGNTQSFSHNEKHQLAQITNARNQSSNLIYDEMNRVVEKQFNGNPYAAYTYNDNGALVSIEDSLGTRNYLRNSLGFVTEIQYPGDLNMSFTHDANGNILETMYPDGMTVTNTCDVRNRIQSVNWAGNAIDYSYDNVSNLLTENFSNGISTNYSYDENNRLTQILHENTDSIFVSETAQLENGIVNGIQRKSVPEISQYPFPTSSVKGNELNQLVYHNSNQRVFEYDEDKNMISQQITYYGVFTMQAEYSHDNRITNFTTDEQSIQISYDAMGYPNKIVENGVTSLLYYDHKGRLLFEADESGNLQKKYIYKGKRLIASQTSAGETYFYHYNRNGNTMAITNASGDILNAYEYSATGEIIGIQENIANRFTFLGAFGVLRLDNSYFLTSSRVYHTSIGRFIQADPLGIITGTNPYLYAGNNPLNGIDPLGLNENEGTINTQELDSGVDNDYTNAGGTADPYADGLPYRTNNWDIYGSASMNTLEEFSDHPIADLLPDFIGNPLSVGKAIDKLANKEYGGALWQFVPFNNSLEAVGDYINNSGKVFDSQKYQGLGLNQFGNQQNVQCDL